MKKLLLIIPLLMAAAINPFGANAQWTNLTSGTTNTLEEIYAFGPDTVICVGDSGTVLRTTDGGTSWLDISISHPNYHEGVHFPSDTGYIISSIGDVYKSYDRGVSWFLYSGIGGFTGYAIHFTSTNYGYATGDGCMGDYTFSTSDGGASWTQNGGGGCRTYYSVFFSDANNGWRVGTGGDIRNTFDAGITWTTQPSGTTKNLRSVYFVDNNLGFAVGDSGTILNTITGGTSWSPQSSGTADNLYDVFFLDPSNGYAVGQFGTILKTIDGGITWNLETAVTLNDLNDVFFVNGVGYAVGVNGTILKFSPPPHCSNAIMDFDETGIDCGGIDCAPCGPPPHCSNAIMDFDETGIDCGGIDCGSCGGSCYANFVYSVDTATNTVFFIDSSYSPDSIYDWLWDFGDGFTDFVQNPTHTYTIPIIDPYIVCLTITDDGGCTDTWCDSVWVGSPPPPSCYADWEYFLDTTLNVSFNDLSSNAFSWTWDFNNDGIDDAFSPTPSWTYDSAGTYNVCLTIWDSLGTCTDTFCQPITVPGCPGAHCSDGIQNCDETGVDCGGIDCAPCSGCTAGITDSTDASCFGVCDGSATVTVTVGTFPYTYSWSPAPGGGQGTSNVTGLCGGTIYTVAVTDAGGNTCSANITIGEPPAVVISSEIPTDITACGANDGTITITASGGTPPLQYSIDGGVTFTGGGSFSGLSAGSYPVVVSDVNGCTVTGSTLTISEPGAPPAPAAGTNATYCEGDAMADLIATAGSGGTLTWYDDAGLTNVVGTGTTFTPSSTVGTSTYYVTETVSGCQSPASSVVITVNPLLVIDSISSTDESCPGCCDGSATANVTGGTGAYTYSWSDGQTVPTAINMCANSYDITVTDSNGCTATDTIIIGSPLCNITTSIAGTDVSCSGNCDGEADLTVSNGTAPYTYAWSNGANTEDITNLCEDAYTVTVTDSNGCTASDSVTVSALNNLVILTSSSEASCAAVCNGTATGIGTGGTSPYTYLWDDPSAQASSTANFLCAGTYVVTVTDAAGCSDTASVTVNSLPEMILNVNITNATCGNADGGATVSPSGGTGAYTYSWSSGDTLDIADSLTSGLYIVTVTDAVGCSNFANVTISDANGPTITVVTSTDVTCNGGSDGVIGINVTDGTSPYILQWSNGSSGNFIFNLLAGPYEINVTDANGCVATQSIAITEPDALALTTSTVDASCGNADGIATVSVSGGTGAYTYSWSTGGNTSTETGLGAGVYDVTVTDAIGCVDSAAVAISNINGPLITVDSIIDISCDNPSGGSIYITVTGGYTPYTYLWSNNDTIQDLLNIQGGIYDVTVTDTSGCVATASMEILGLLPTGDSICVVTVDSASGKNLIVWQKTTGANIKSYNIYKESTQAGVYYLIGSVPFNALSAFTDSLSNPVIRSWRYKIAAVDSCDNESELSKEHKTMHLTINLGINNTINLIWDHYQGFDFGTYFIYRYTISTGWEEIDSMASNLTSWTDPTPPGGNIYYQVVVKPPSVCAATKKAEDYNSSRSNTTSVSTPNALTATATSTDATQGNCDGTATATAGGGTSPYTYLWSDPNSQTTATATGLCGNMPYTVVVTDFSGDTVSANVIVGESIGIEDIGFADGIKIYPNPNRGVFTLSTNSEFNTNVRIVVYDVLGRKAWPTGNRSLARGNNEIEIDMNDHPAGIYHLQLITDKVIVNKRVVLE